MSRLLEARVEVYVTLKSESSMPLVVIVFCRVLVASTVVLVVQRQAGMKE